MHKPELLYIGKWPVKAVFMAIGRRGFKPEGFRKGLVKWIEHKVP